MTKNRTTNEEPTATKIGSIPEITPHGLLKLLVIVPLGSIAFSTMGGNRMVSHTAVSYSKYFLSDTKNELPCGQP